jgi:hypothetical protein
MPAITRRDATTTFFIPHSSINLLFQNVSPMLPGSLVLATNHSLIIVHPDVVLAMPNPSAGRLKCSWHLGMMMRIIETPLLKGKPDLLFGARKTLYARTP